MFLPVFLFDILALPLIFTLLVASTSHFLTTAIKNSYFSCNVNLCLSSTSMKTLKFGRGKDSALCWFFFSLRKCRWRSLDQQNTLYFCRNRDILYFCRNGRSARKKIHNFPIKSSHLCRTSRHVWLSCSACDHCRAYQGFQFQMQISCQGDNQHLRDGCKGRNDPLTRLLAPPRQGSNISSNLNFNAAFPASYHHFRIYRLIMFIIKRGSVEPVRPPLSYSSFRHCVQFSRSYWQPFFSTE